MNCRRCGSNVLYTEPVVDRCGVRREAHGIALCCVSCGYHEYVSEQQLEERRYDDLCSRYQAWRNRGASPALAARLAERDEGGNTKC